MRSEESRRKARQEALDRLTTELPKAAAELLVEAQNEVVDIKRQLQNIDSSPQQDLAAADNDVRQANEQAEQRRRTVQQAREQLSEADELLNQSRQLRDAANEKLVEARTGHDAITIETIQAELLQQRTRLAAEFPELEASSDQLEQSRRRQAEAERESREIKQRLDVTRGKLELTGGAVVRDQLESASAELARVESEAADLELEYDAVRHLFQTLTQTSKRTAAHLGNSLAGPVAERLRSLTGDRYADLIVDPGLKVQHVVAGHSERAHEAMSVGTRHQLATLIRLSLATHLNSTLVLDDQLVHSDVNRLLWFREQLKAMTSNGQMQALVITCRPLDYLTAEELEPPSGSTQRANNPLLTVIDLAARIGA